MLLPKLPIGKRVLKVKSRKRTERKSLKRREVEAQAVRGNQERMGKKTIKVDQRADQEVALVAGTNVEEIMIETVVAEEDIKVGLTGIVTGIGKGIVIGNGIGKEIGIVRGTETEEGIEIVIGTGIVGGEIAVGPVVIQEAAPRGARRSRDLCRSPLIATVQDPGQDQDLIPKGRSIVTGVGILHLQVLIDRLVRSHQGTDARTEQLAQGGTSNFFLKLV